MKNTRRRRRRRITTTTTAQKASERSKYFPAKRGRKPTCPSATILRIMDEPTGLTSPFPELIDGMLYIKYEKEQWFLLDQLVHIIWRFAGKPNGKDENGILRKMESFCCPKECKDYILTMTYIWIKTVECNDPILLGQLSHSEHKFTITEHTCCITNNAYEDDAMNNEWFSTYKIGGRGGYGYLPAEKMVHLIEFRSTSLLMDGIFDPLVVRLISFTRAYHFLCSKRTKSARMALTKADKERVAASQAWKCNNCEELFRVDTRYEVDHILPVHRGGENGRYNLQALCVPCHKGKTERERSYPLRPIVMENVNVVEQRRRERERYSSSSASSSSDDDIIVIHIENDYT
jgi:hypothetical protein